jgi:hypothetical protein
MRLGTSLPLDWHMPPLTTSTPHPLPGRYSCCQSTTSISTLFATVFTIRISWAPSVVRVFVCLCWMYAMPPCVLCDGVAAG